MLRLYFTILFFIIVQIVLSSCLTSPVSRRSSTVPITSDSDNSSDFIAPASLSLVPSPGMPHQVTLCDGTPLTLREMRPDDIPKFYVALLTAMKSGVGYGVDELPDLDYFVTYYINGWRNLVFELTGTTDAVAYGNTDGPTVYSRSVTNPAIADGGNFVVVENFRGKGWYSELLSIGMTQPMEKNTGVNKGQPAIVGYQADMAMTNLRNYKAARNFRYRVNGVLPRGMYLQGLGWIDIVLSYLRRDEMMIGRSAIVNPREETPPDSDGRELVVRNTTSSKL